MSLLKRKAEYLTFVQEKLQKREQEFYEFLNMDPLPAGPSGKLTVGKAQINHLNDAIYFTIQYDMTCPCGFQQKCSYVQRNTPLLDRKENFFAHETKEYISVNFENLEHEKTHSFRKNNSFRDENVLVQKE